MEKAQLFDKKSRRRKMKWPSLVTAVFIVATITLASIAVLLSGLAQHYHDSKYRAQYELVSTLVDSLLTAQPDIENMISNTSANYDRLGLAISAGMSLAQAHEAAWAIMVMYPENSTESSAFHAIALAADQVQLDVNSYQSKLHTAIQYNETYASNITINSLFLNATRQMTDLIDLVSAGRDSARDWQESPYSLVKRMDLAAIESVSRQIEETGIQLAQLFPH